MESAIIVAVITSIASVVIAIINNKGIRSGNKERKKFAAKQSILQMITEDEIAVELMGKMPSNHSRILYEADQYHQSGGNSDLDEKLEEYKKWYDSLELKKER